MDTTKRNRDEAARQPRQAAPGGAAQEQRKRPVQEALRQSRAGTATAEPPRKKNNSPSQDTKAQGNLRQKPAAGRTAAGSAPQGKRAGTQSGKTAQPRRRAPEDVPDKKRVYGKSKPKKSTVATMGNAVRHAMQDGAAKRKARRKRSGQRPQQPTPAVIYTQPKVFNRNRLVVQLLTVTAMVLALVLGFSVFFKVVNITVTGENVYDDWTIREASGIKEGDSLLTFSRARAGALIIANLPYVKNVSFGIKLPDTVNIIVEEEDVVYAIQDTNAQWWLMNSEGRVVEMAASGKASNYTQVLGVTLFDPISTERAIAAENVFSLEEETTGTDPTEESTEAPPIGTSGAQRLSTALQILQALEANDIVGTAASVDVTQLENIVLWYGSRYQVEFGDASNLDYKVACMNDVILQMGDYQSGVLDISFTIWNDRVVYTPFG